MMNITPQQFRKAADIQEKIQSLQEELGQLLGGPVHPARSNNSSVEFMGMIQIHDYVTDWF